jgi:hypothetical protein
MFVRFWRGLNKATLPSLHSQSYARVSGTFHIFKTSLDLNIFLCLKKQIGSNAASVLFSDLYLDTDSPE